jgi:hypothetical protein
VQPDFLCSHLDQNSYLGSVGEKFVEFVDMPIEGHANTLPPFLVKHASNTVSPFLPLVLSCKSVDCSLTRGEKLGVPCQLHDVLASTSGGSGVVGVAMVFLGLQPVVCLARRTWRFYLYAKV